MKIALICQSLLLSKSLEIFLKNKITSYKKCDFVICDKKLDIDKPQFVISHNDANLNMPFSESSLIIELEKFYNDEILNLPKVEESVSTKNEDLEEKIDEITKKFRDDLINVIVQYYEK
ncbi:MAG: hypothetical protein R3331_10070 [Sulfurospirillaceae bacterium]|nr:hypothetical protein [Sulfurospirillaceae bacterium]